MVDVPCSCSDEKFPDYQSEKLTALGPRTDEVYRTYNLPSKFIYPSKFQKLIHIYQLCRSYFILS